MAKLTKQQRADAEQSLAEEREAIASYTRRRKGTSGPLREAFDHALPEERDHARMFEKSLENAE